MSGNLSKLGFGLSSIAGSGDFKHQQKLINTAIDCGVTHFDVAPYYGSGDAETILGNILVNCSHPVTITTKFGLVPVSFGRGGSLLRSTLRPVFRRFHFLKTLAGTVISKDQQPNRQQFEKGSMLASLQASIKKIQRPVDVFLLHDADVAFAQNPHLLEELDEVKRLSHTAQTGISGDPDTVMNMITWRPETYTIGQFENSLTRDAHIKPQLPIGTKLITHRAIQGGLSQLSYLFENRPGFKNIWQRVTGIDIKDNELIARILIELALTENPNGTVLFSTTNPDRIKQIAGVVLQPIAGPENCKKIRQIFEDVYIDLQNLPLC